MPGLEVGQVGRWGPLAVLVAIAMGWAAALVGSGHVGMDEANTLATAWRVAQGDRLYQEAWEFIAPWPFEAMALLYGWWGPSLDLARGVAALWALLTAGVAYRLARALGAGPWWALAAPAAIAWGSTPLALLWYHHGWSQPLLLLALLCAAEAIAKPKALSWFLAGLCGAAAGLCTQSLTLVAFPALSTAWALWALAPQQPGRAKAGGALLAGLALPWALTTLAFAWQGGALAFWTQVWWWPATHYRLPGSGNEVRPWTDLGALLFPFGREAMSYPAWLLRGVAWGGWSLVQPLAVLGAWAACLRVFRPGFSGPWPSPMAWAMAVGLLLQLAVLWRGRSDLAHAQMSSHLACVWLSAWAARLWAEAGPWRDGQGEAPGLLRAVALGWLALVLAAGGSQAWQLRALVKAGRWCPGGLDAQLRATPAMQALAQHRRPGDRLFAFPAWGVGYLLGGVKPATRYTLFTRLDDRYYDASEYAAFRADWAASPPDLVALLDVSATEAVPQWGGQPSLQAYRLVHEGRFVLGSQAVPFSLWRRKAARP